MITRLVVAMLITAATQIAAADDRSEYNRRAANSDLAAFRQLDLNRDGRLTADEARADVNLFPRFSDIDINRDGVITTEEMRRYLEQTYGVQTAG